MTVYIRSPLTYTWAFLTAITIASWWISQGGIEHHVNMAVTISVLLIAALKAQLVIMYFMEVRVSAFWLKLTTYGWNIMLLLLLVGFYFSV